MALGALTPANAANQLPPDAEPESFEQTLLVEEHQSLAFQPSVLSPQRHGPVQLPRTPVRPAGTQNPPVGVPPGYGQPTQPGYSPGLTGGGDPGSTPYIHPRPTAGLDGLIQEGFGSRPQQEMMAILDGLVSTARDSENGRSTITVPVGNASRPQGYVNITYDRNNGMLYTSDATGRNATVYDYVPITNLLERLRLPAANSSVYRDYTSLNWALSSNGRAPAYPPRSTAPVAPQQSTSTTPQPVATQRANPAPAFTGDQLEQRVAEFLPRSGANDPVVYGTDGWDRALSAVADWNRRSDAQVAVALDVTYWDPHTKQEARTWVGYFGVDPGNVSNLIRNVDATNGFNVNNKDRVLTDSGLSGAGLEARARRLEDRAFAENLPTIGGRRMEPVLSQGNYETFKATIAGNNAAGVAAGRIDQIDLIIPADNGRAAFIQNVTRGNAVSLLNSAQRTGILRDGVDLNSVVAANGLQDLIGVQNGRAVVKPAENRTAELPQATTETPDDWRSLPGLNESEVGFLEEQFQREGITNPAAQRRIAEEVASGRRTAYEAIRAFTDGQLGFSGGGIGNTIGTTTAAAGDDWRASHVTPELEAEILRLFEEEGVTLQDARFTPPLPGYRISAEYTQQSNEIVADLAQKIREARENGQPLRLIDVLEELGAKRMGLLPEDAVNREAWGALRTSREPFTIQRADGATYTIVPYSSRVGTGFIGAGDEHPEYEFYAERALELARNNSQSRTSNLSDSTYRYAPEIEVNGERIPLTETMVNGDLSYGAWLNPYGANVDKVLPRIAFYFRQAQTASTPEAALDATARMAWLYYQASPYGRGSAAIGQWLITSALESHGITYDHLSPGVALDGEAFTRTEADFEQNFKNFFVNLEQNGQPLNAR